MLGKYLRALYVPNSLFEQIFLRTQVFVFSSLVFVSGISCFLLEKVARIAMSTAVLDPCHILPSLFQTSWCSPSLTYPPSHRFAPSALDTWPHSRSQASYLHAPGANRALIIIVITIIIIIFIIIIIIIIYTILLILICVLFILLLIYYDHYYHYYY